MYHNIVMHNMKTATVRDLRYHFPMIEAWLGGGQEVLITKHSKPLAKLSPQQTTPKRKLQHPDYRARLKRIWGDRVFTSAEVEEMRAFETGEP
jgi:antitoxin (DNA-binding transcriptional repressor) of toxin-antitoxin stability system